MLVAQSIRGILYVLFRQWRDVMILSKCASFCCAIWCSIIFIFIMTLFSPASAPGGECHGRVKYSRFHRRHWWCRVAWRRLLIGRVMIKLAANDADGVRYKVIASSIMDDGHHRYSIISIQCDALTSISWRPAYSAGGILMTIGARPSLRLYRCPMMAGSSYFRRGACFESERQILNWWRTAMRRDCGTNSRRRYVTY